MDAIVARDVVSSDESTRRRFLYGAFGLAATWMLAAAPVEAKRRGNQRRKRATSKRTGKRLRSRAQRLALKPGDGSQLERCLTRDYRSLSLYNRHTGERFTAEYFIGGQYDDACLEEINWVLRDHYTDAVRPIDPRLLDVLYAIRTELDSDDELQVLSGYRSPETNWRKFLSEPGVALQSFHMTGQAIDFFVPRRSLHTVHRVAVALGGGGVGYYPRSGFVHVDTGPVRYW